MTLEEMNKTMDAYISPAGSPIRDSLKGVAKILTICQSIRTVMLVAKARIAIIPVRHAHKRKNIGAYE